MRNDPFAHRKPPAPAGSEPDPAPKPKTSKRKPKAGVAEPAPPAPSVLPRLPAGSSISTEPPVANREHIADRPAYVPPPPPAFLQAKVSPPEAAANVLPCVPAGSPVQSDVPATSRDHTPTVRFSLFTVAGPGEKPVFLKAVDDPAAAAAIAKALVPQPGTWIPPHRRRPNH